MNKELRHKKNNSIKFIVDRSKWRSGAYSPNMTGEGDTYLRNNEGFMCCLGFCCEQLDNDDIDDVAEPSDITWDSENPLIYIEEIHSDHIVCFNTTLSKKAIEINDNGDITQKEREKRLRKLFKTHGHQIVFKGKAVKLKK